MDIGKILNQGYHWGDLPKAAKMLRLAFHDCVLYTGHCVFDLCRPDVILKK